MGVSQPNICDMGIEKKSLHILPDMLSPGVRLVFCGTAAGPVSAALGHYYAHPQNKFWRTLHEIGLTPRLLAPAEYALLAQWGIGLTDIAKFHSGLDRDLPTPSLGRAACADLEKRITVCAPDILAFTSLTAGRKFLGAAATLGSQPEKIGGAAIWVLPSPSPLAQWNWDIAWWKKLATRLAS
jgi:TDG/mug DNA glycosylase family protein